MIANRAEVVDANFLAFLERAPSAPRALRPEDPVRPGSSLSCAKLLELFESQLLSRQLDLVARELRARNVGYYTIGSSGHEGNVVLGELVTRTDPTFLHYRSGALMAQRWRQGGEGDFALEVLLGSCAAADDRTSGGRHKVWGSRALWVPPQTSTIASHLPKAVGAALAINRAGRLKLPLPIPGDAIAMCNFGDASLNHSTAQGAINAASWTAHQGLPVPLLFVCEDNGIGISVATPQGWVQARMSRQPAITYVQADGLDLVDAWEGAARAVEIVRRERKPVFLHLRTVRLLGHAGSDYEQEYRSLAEIEASEAQDPLLRSAALVLETGLRTPAQLRELYEGLRARVRAAGDEAARRPKLTTPAQVTRSLAPYTPEAVRAEARRAPDSEAPARPAIGRQRHLAAMINRGLQEALVKYPQALVFGEDVARKGGVYHVTAGLWKEFGPGRVFNTLLDEQAILGLAIGAAHLGFLPIPELQYLAYYHNAEDQIRGEACSLQFFSNGQFRNPMVVRIASFAYQKGFGGHFHNDNSIGALRDIPGLILAVPARGDDAVKLLRTCMALAQVDGRVVAILEPIALYMTKDLYEEGDGLWLSDYPAPGEAIEPGEGQVYHDDARDLTIVSYGNGLYRSLRAARTLREEHGITARVVDLRWLAPLNLDLIEREALRTGRLLVVDECRRSGGPGEAILAAVHERCGGHVTARLVAGVETYMPLGPAMDLVLPSEADIIDAAVSLATRAARLAL